MSYPPENALRAAEALCCGCIAWTPEEYEELMRAYEVSPKSAFNPVPIKGYSAAWNP